jgi:hypothetical protein
VPECSAVPGAVIDGDTAQGEGLGAINAEYLDRGVLDRDTGDSRGRKGVGVEELGLGLAAIASLSVPPASPTTVEDGSRSTSDGDISSRDGDERAGPFLVPEAGGALEYNLHLLAKAMYTGNQVLI